MESPGKAVTQDLLSRYLKARSNFREFKQLEEHLNGLTSEDLINELWAALSIAADARAEAQDRAAANQQLHSVVERIAMTNGKNEFYIQHGNMNIGQVGSNFAQNSIIGGGLGSSVVMERCATRIESIGSLGNAKSLLVDLQEIVTKTIDATVEPQKKEQIARDFESLVTEVSSAQPRRKWYELSGEGLVAAANAVLGVGERAAKIISDLAAIVPGLAN